MKPSSELAWGMPNRDAQKIVRVQRMVDRISDRSKGEVQAQLKWLTLSVCS